jgi:hypothetical protein
MRPSAPIMSASYAIMPRSRADLRLRDTVDGRATAAADAVEEVSGCSGASGIAAPQGRADRRRGDHATRQPGVSTAEPHNHTGAVIVHAECAELDALASRRSSRKFGVSEIRNFRHYSNTKNILASDGPSCPVLSCPVLWSRSFWTNVRINADEKRTRCGRKADTNPTGALRTRFGLKLGVSRRRRRRAGRLSRASARGHARTSVRTDADRMRTKSGQMSASKRTKCGQKADRMRTRRQPISTDRSPSARMHAAMTAPVVSLSPRR